MSRTVQSEEQLKGRQIPNPGRKEAMAGRALPGAKKKKKATKSTKL